MADDERPGKEGRGGGEKIFADAACTSEKEGVLQYMEPHGRRRRWDGDQQRDWTGGPGNAPRRPSPAKVPRYGGTWAAAVLARCCWRTESCPGPCRLGKLGHSASSERACVLGAAGVARPGLSTPGTRAAPALQIGCNVPRCSSVPAAVPRRAENKRERENRASAGWISETPAHTRARDARCSKSNVGRTRGSQVGRAGRVVWSVCISLTSSYLFRCGAPSRGRTASRLSLRAKVES